MKKRAALIARPASAPGTRRAANSLERQNTLGPHASVQRNTANSGSIPRIVQEVLSSPGEPLDSSTRAYFEPRFRATLGNVPASGLALPLTPRPLRLGQQRDSNEQEADRLAQQVVRETASSAATPAPGAFDFSRVRLHTGQEAAESARRIHAVAFTAGNHVVCGAGSESPGTARGRLILAHELAHVVQQSRAGGDATTVRRFAEFTPDEQLAGDSLGWKHPGGSPLRVSDDGQIAAEDNGWGPGTNHRAWTTASKVAESNGILGKQNSRAFLQAKGGGQDIGGNAPASGATTTLQEIEPVKSGGGPINLTSDCGTACRQIMGSGGKDEAVIKKEPSTLAGEVIGSVVGLAAGGAAGAGIGLAAGGGKGAVFGAIIGAGVGAVGGAIAGGAIANATTSEETLTPREYHGGGGKPGAPLTPAEEWSEEIYKKEFGQNLSRQEALNRYNSLSDDEKDKFDRKYGINKYAVPRVGQGVTIGTEYDMPGYADPSHNAWNFHYAANVLSSGQDYVTLESAAGWKPDEWIFYMYGPASKSQSFYEEQRATGTHGTKNTALVVQPAK
jgi:hypothetical protein